MATRTKEERGVNPKHFGSYGHLPEPATDSIETLLEIWDSRITHTSPIKLQYDYLKLALKELIIHSAKLEIRIQELETIIFHSQED